MLGINHRIKDLRKASGLTREAFAIVLSEKPSKIQDIESGRQRVNDEFLRKLIQQFPVDMNWLFDLTGFGGSGYPRIEPPDPDRPMPGHFVADGEAYSMVRRLDLSVSAGNGLIPVADGNIDRLAFSKSWLDQRGLAADLCVLVRVNGDSMSPTIPDGSLALLNAAERDIQQAGVYAYTYEDAAFIKRLLPAHPGPDGRPLSIVVAADNPQYPPVTLLGNQMNSLHVVGRVRAVLSEF